MDSLTQIVLGASVSGAVGFKCFGRKALVTGALLGTLPDLDVLIHYQTAVEDFTFHRGFSHSLFVLSLLSLFLYYLALLFIPKLFNPKFFNHQSYEHKKALFLTIALPLLTHPLLDAFTTYGTQLLWPLNIPPISWSSIFIIDPLFTLPLLVAVAGLYFRKNSKKWQKINRLMLTISCLYLCLGQAQFWFIKQQVMKDPITQNNPVFIAPTPFNTIVWRVLSYHQDTYYETYTTLFNKQPLIWKPYDTGRTLLDSFHSQELQRLEWFTNGLLQFTKQDEQLVATDLRIGIPHFYPFSFTLAKWKADSNWQEQMSEKMPQQKINLENVTKLIQSYQ